MNEDLVDLVHYGICLFRARLLDKRREAFHITEHDGDLFTFAFNLPTLSQSFLCETFGEIALNLSIFSSIERACGEESEEVLISCPYSLQNFEYSGTSC